MVGVTIDCMYSCALCGIIKAHVDIPVRTDTQDVAFWMEKVAAPRLSEDHAKRSPFCYPKTLSEVYIPVDGARMIGGAVEN